MSVVRQCLDLDKRTKNGAIRIDRLSVSVWGGSLDYLYIYIYIYCKKKGVVLIYSTLSTTYRVNFNLSKLDRTRVS